MNWLKRENCNKAKCKTCIFQTNGNQLELNPGRLDEIRLYLARGESSHICHTTNLTCYGAMEFQAEIFHTLKFIPEPTVDSLLDTAKNILNL